MSSDQSRDSPHLPSLSVMGFRGIKELHVPRLGRATLLAGKNGTGKTTVLEAVRAYAARGRAVALSSVTSGREEFLTTLDEDGNTAVAPNVAALFHGRQVSAQSRIVIGPVDGQYPDSLKIEVVALDDETAEIFDPLESDVSAAPALILQISCGGRKRSMARFMFSRLGETSTVAYRFFRNRHSAGNGDELPPAIACQLLGPGVLRNDDAVRHWDSVVLREEDRVVQALNLVVADTVERVALRGMLTERPRTQRFEVRVRGRDEPVPLRSLGDGAVRFFGTAIALARSRDGFLLIDEAENGIHHSVQATFWRMVLLAAAANNVQVIATTHSFDCVRGFAQAVEDTPDASGVLVRLERDGDQTRAVTYEEDQMKSAAEYGIEVR